LYEEIANWRFVISFPVAHFYKGMGVTTIAGGQHFMQDNIAEALSSGIDYVVIGEGTVKELLQAIEGKLDVSEVEGIAYLNEGEVIYTAQRRFQR
jgi:radical SAM superfamily enzyme YgiQ (UPF0313 family)